MLKWIRNWSRVLVFAVVVLSICLIGWRSFHDKPKKYHPSGNALAIANEAIDALAAAPQADVSDKDAVVALLEAASIEYGPGAKVDKERRLALFQLVATWLDLLRRADVDAYIAWRESTGCHLPSSIEEKYNRPDLAMGYHYYTHTLMPDNITYYNMFRVLFTGALSGNGREMRPVRIAAGPAVGGTRFALTEAHDEFVGKIFYEDFPHDPRWTSNNGGDGRIHWQLPTTWDEVVRRDGDALAAYLRIGIGNEKGQWWPQEIYCFYDKQKKQWLLDYAVRSNTFIIKENYEY